MKAARSQNTLEDIIQTVKSKRYPRTRIQRLLLCAYLGISTQDLQRPISYARILAVSPAGRPLLRQAREHGALPLINPGQTPDDRGYYQIETRTSDLFTLFAAPEYPCSAASEQSARLF